MKKKGFFMKAAALFAAMLLFSPNFYKKAVDSNPICTQTPGKRFHFGGDPKKQTKTRGRVIWPSGSRGTYVKAVHGQIGTPKPKK